MSDFQSPHNTAFTPISPAERYAQALASGQFLPDQEQAQAVLYRRPAGGGERVGSSLARINPTF